jgi:hypothetical protein
MPHVFDGKPALSIKKLREFSGEEAIELINGHRRLRHFLSSAVPLATFAQRNRSDTMTESHPQTLQ